MTEHAEEGTGPGTRTEGRREANEDLIRELTRAWNERDRAALEAVHAEEILLPGEEVGSERYADRLDREWAFFEAFPDVTAETEELLADEDRVLVRWTVSGTHEGKFVGVDPTGTEVEYEEWALYRIEGGEVVEARFMADHLGLLEQLDVVEVPGE